MMLSSVENIIYEHIEKVYLICHVSLCQKMITPYSKLFVNEYKNRNILHINKFLPLYLFYNLTDYIQILVNYSK